MGSWERGDDREIYNNKTRKLQLTGLEDLHNKCPTREQEITLTPGHDPSQWAMSANTSHGSTGSVGLKRAEQDWMGFNCKCGEDKTDLFRLAANGSFPNGMKRHEAESIFRGWICKQVVGLTDFNSHWSTSSGWCMVGRPIFNFTALHTLAGYSVKARSHMVALYTAYIC